MLHLPRALSNHAPQFATITAAIITPGRQDHADWTKLMARLPALSKRRMLLVLLLLLLLVLK
jgi:hypothetical protein